MHGCYAGPILEPGADLVTISTFLKQAWVEAYQGNQDFDQLLAVLEIQGSRKLQNVSIIHIEKNCHLPLVR